MLALIVVLTVAGCGRDGSSADPAEGPVETTSAVVEEETQPASPAVDASPDDASADLRQLAVTLTTQARDGEWEAVRPFVPDEIAALDDALLHRELAGLQLPAGIGTKSSDWEVEEYSEWVTVRLSDIPFVALIFRQDSDGSYYLDPGPHVLQRVAHYPQDGTPEPTIQSPEGYQQQLVTEDDDDLVPISRHLHRSVEGISYVDSGVTLTVSWMFNRGASGSLPIDGLRWTDGDASGEVRIVWTTAKVTSDELQFPVPEGLQAGGSYGYRVSFSPIGLDASASGDLHLLVEGVTLNLTDGEQFTFTIDHVIPSHSSHQVVRVTPTARLITPLTTPIVVEPRCEESEIVPIMASFLDAFNRGEWEAVDRHLPDEGHPRGLVRPDPGDDQRVFYSFAMDDTVYVDPDEVMASLMERHASGERLALQDMAIGGMSHDPRWNLPELADFGVQLIREANDVLPHTIAGKGVLNCVTEEILMWVTVDAFAEDVLDTTVLGTDRPLFTPVP